MRSAVRRCLRLQELSYRTDGRDTNLRLLKMYTLSLERCAEAQWCPGLRAVPRRRSGAQVQRTTEQSEHPRPLLSPLAGSPRPGVTRAGGVADTAGSGRATRRNSSPGQPNPRIPPHTCNRRRGCCCARGAPASLSKGAQPGAGAVAVQLNGWGTRRLGHPRSGLRGGGLVRAVVTVNGAAEVATRFCC